MRGENESYEVCFADRALDDAEALKEYLSDELGMADAARRAMEQIFHAADRLASFPLRNRVIARGKAGVELRRALAGNYMLLYITQDTCVTILAVVHAASNVSARLKSAFEGLNI